MKRVPELESAFAPFIRDFIDQKKSDGYDYSAEEEILARFDRFITRAFPGETVLSRDIFLAWSEKRESEGANFRARRVTAVRQLALYMDSLGIDAYISHDRFSTEKPHARVLTQEELSAFFAEVDKGRGYGSSLMFDIEYQVLFRLCYCCGLRLNEACSLKWGNVDADAGTIMIVDSKNRKDRIVYMADDMAALMRRYRERIKDFSPEDAWVFPGGKPGAHVLKTSICKIFRQIWSRTPYAGKATKRPTTHSLRHGFVVDRMNAWMLEGVDLATKAPYLSMYLGHESMEETFYYYHQANKAYQIIKEKDFVSGTIIPEVGQ